MQDDDNTIYGTYLQEGMRLEIGIPLSGGGIFRDWAVVSEYRADEILVQISRDMLPANVRIEVGFILDVSVWVRKDVYTCCGIVIERLGGRVLRIRLFGRFTLRERRQFFRIELNLRLKFARAREGSLRQIESDWERRRDLEHMKTQGYDNIVIAAQSARHLPAIPLEWQDLLWAEVNLGGGGICLRLSEPVLPEQFLNLEIHLPLTPPRQIQAVAQVVYVAPPKVITGAGTCYPAGLQFVFLDERDRDLIFRHISVSQIAYLRKMADHRALAEPDPRAESDSTSWQVLLRRAFWGLVFLALIWYLVGYFTAYRLAGPSGEIQRTYEKAIRQHRQLKP